MSDRVLYDTEAAVKEANVIGISIADAGATPTPLKGKIRLFDETLIPVVTTTQAELEAAETALIGYPVGGYDITAMATPIGAPGGGVVIQSNLVQVVYASGASVTIGGYWVEDSDGDVRQIFIYDPQRVLAAIPDGFPIVAQFGYGRNS